MQLTQNQKRRASLDKQFDFECIIGNHPKLLDILELVGQVAITKATVLIYGESGTGKELIAQTLHRNSQRKDKPFVALNCGAFQDTLLESELFGHIRGAFTGATSYKKGWFEHANGGTIFFDEIHDMSPALQSKLLRILQTGQFAPLGSVEIKRSDVRIIAATNRDLELLSKQGSFREELFYRLNVIDLYLPPLRKRKSDIPALLRYFTALFGNEYGKFEMDLCNETVKVLEKYDYPGNIRELRNIVERLVVLCKKEAVQTKHLPHKLQTLENSTEEVCEMLHFHEAKESAIEQFERRFLKRSLELTHGNVREAARASGLHFTSFHSKLRKYRLDPDLFRSSTNNA